MSTPADRDPQTPFDAQLDAAPDAGTHGTVASALGSQSVGAPTPSTDQARWEAFRRDKLLPVLKRERQLSHAMQLAMAAVGGALLVVVTSTVMGLVIPRPNTPTVANNQHPLVTVEDLTAKALKEKGVDGVQPSGTNALGADGNTVTMPDAPTTGESDANTADTASDTSAADASDEGSGNDDSSSTSLAALSSDPKRERKRARRQQDRILSEQRDLEDRKRAIERQIEDKGLEERRRQEDQTLIESRMADDQRRRDERRSEDERSRAEEQQTQSQNHDPKLAQVP